MQRTIRLKLNTTEAQRLVLVQTLTSFTQAFNFVCQYGWLKGEKNGIELHKAMYYELKAQLGSFFPSQLICAARVKATEALKSAFARKKTGRKTTQPHSALCPVRYDQRSYRLSWATGQTSLATPNGRLLLGFEVPSYAVKYSGYPVDSADLIYRRGRFWLHVVVTLPDPPTLTMVRLSE